MFQIDQPTAASSLPAPAAASTPGYFTGGNPASGIPATIVDADYMNMLMMELMNVIIAGGQTASKTTYNQLLLAIETLIEVRAGNYALDTGVANAYVVALSPALTSYTNGDVVRVRAVNANTGASTLNAGGGIISLVNDQGGALVSGDVPAGSVFTAVYDSVLVKFLITSLVPSQAMSQTQGDARYLLQTNVVTAAGDPTFADNSTKAASTGWVRGAMAAIATAAGFASSFGANGYIKFPSWLGGWVVQWGGYTPGVNAGSSAITFPISFPTACYGCWAGCNAVLVGNELLTYSCYPPSVSGTNIQYYSSNTTLRASYWLALGK
jgi:hypothetical protein